MSVIYKILFEVKLLHEYYLTRIKGDNIFDGADADARNIFLLEQFKNGNRSINNDVNFIIPELQLQLFKNHHLRIIPSYCGFKIAIKCKDKIAVDGSIVYKPFVPLPDDLNIMIVVHQKNNISSFSNTPFKKPFASVFYFSNDNTLSVKQFPFLSAPVPTVDNSIVYEQGEITLFPNGTINVFLNNGAATPWKELNGTGYINETDRLLLPLSFQYVFTAADNITEAQFSLKDAAGTIIKNISATSSTALRSVLLNFRTDGDRLITLPAAESIYTLDVSASNGYNRSFKLLFAVDEINLSGVAGLISIKTKVANAAFNLTDNEGLLYTRILPGAIKKPAPVFELWMKSRMVYWKFSNNKFRKIKTTTDTQDVLTNVDDNGDGQPDGILITNDPHPLTYTPILVKRSDSTFQYLPNPLPGDLVKIEGTRSIMNILVPESKMFPLA